MPDKSTIKTNPLELLDQNNEDPKGEDSIAIDTSPIVKRGRGRPRKYANITLFLQDDVNYETSR